jgi:hypothetical protein
MCMALVFLSVAGYQACRRLLLPVQDSGAGKLLPSSMFLWSEPKAPLHWQGLGTDQCHSVHLGMGHPTIVHLAL